MHFNTSSVIFTLLLSSALAGPIQRPNNVIRHPKQPPKRYVPNNATLATYRSPRRRQAPTDPAHVAAATREITSIQASSTSNLNPFAAATGSGTEDGTVPAVGVGGDNTSLLSLLTQSTVEGASKTQTQTQNTGATTEAAFSSAATGVVPVTLTGNSSITAVQTGTETGSGKDDGSVPAVGVGGDNTSLLSLLTQTSSTVPVAGATTVVTDTATPPATDSSGASQISSFASITAALSQTAATGTAIIPNAAPTQNSAQASPQAQDQPTTTITIQAQTTVLETSLVTVQVEPPATTASPTSGLDTVFPTTSAKPLSTIDGSNTFPSSVTAPVPAPGNEQGDQPPSSQGEITIVFATMSPTFTGVIGGFTTLGSDANGNVATTTATDVQETTVQSSPSPLPLPPAAGEVPASLTLVLTSTSTPTPTPSPSSPANTLTQVSTTDVIGGLSVIPVTPNPVQAQITATITETVSVTITVTAG